MIMENTFRQKLDQGLPTIGTHFLFAEPDIPEMIGDSGCFDYAEFVGEYSTFDMSLLYHLARAGQCGNLPLMIKLDQEAQAFWAQVALGAGFKSVLFTDVRTAEDVDLCHAAIRPDKPGNDARMGVKLRRPALSGYNTDKYGVDLDSIVSVIMIEKGVTVDNIDSVLERAKARGIDMTQWGPADFTFSKGDTLRGTNAVREYEELVIAKSIEYDVQPRIEIGEVEQAKRYIDLGVRHFCIGWDRFIYSAAISRLGNGLKELLATI
ncbi:MAG: hypothetical protein F4W90_09165 [Gammaproteobacteria bacterium]|nr:hypothetical protein [Gammaproteobacteria bacterium]